MTRAVILAALSARRTVTAPPAGTLRVMLTPKAALERILGEAKVTSEVEEVALRDAARQPFFPCMVLIVVDQVAIPLLGAVQKHLADKELRKIIYRPGRMLNLVVS